MQWIGMQCIASLGGLPDAHKTEFKIIDFWENQFDKQTEDKEKAVVPVLVR